MEARGLDVTPGMMKRLRHAGDERTAQILEIIFRDEVGHVAIGSHWFCHECNKRALEPRETFRELIGQYMAGELRGPFCYDARMKAGFTEDELRALESLSASA